MRAGVWAPRSILACVRIDYEARVKKLEQAMLPRMWEPKKIGVGRLLSDGQSGWTGVELDGQSFRRDRTENQQATLSRACAVMGTDMLVLLVSLANPEGGEYER